LLAVGFLAPRAAAFPTEALGFPGFERAFFTGALALFEPDFFFVAIVASLTVAGTGTSRHRAYAIGRAGRRVRRSSQWRYWRVTSPHLVSARRSPTAAML
jgi:hypothetical protein